MNKVKLLGTDYAVQKPNLKCECKRFLSIQIMSAVQLLFLTLSMEA